ncbi:MAG: hypothetical protein LCI00_07695 [Chloroflexi bacterium]|nr:hypothetical protein [Chloroflexota bacterium]
MDILGGLRVAIDTFWYNLILSLAGLQWSLLRGFIMMGYTIELINRWLATNAFAPLIQFTNNSLQVAVSLAFVIALLVLGITYLLAAFVRLDVVNPRSAIMWYVAGWLFFSIGPSLYQGMNDLRMTIAEGFYASALQGLQNSAGGSFNSLDQVKSTDLDIGPLCDHLEVYLPGATAPGRIDGLDVALAYLRADGPDVMGYPQPMYSPGCPAHLLNPLTGAYISSVPQEWFFDGSYFDAAQSPMNFDQMDDAARATSISLASSSQGRLLTAWPLVLFGVIEQLVYLLITIAQGITFISFAIAILFAFFRRTEIIAQSIVNQWIELIVQTVIIALIQSLVVALFLAGTASASGMVVLGIGLICLVFMVITFWSGVKAVWNSFNRLFNAFGQASGGTIVSPGTAATTAAAVGMAAATGMVSVGSSALAGMTAYNNGATLAQSAGLALGGFSSLSGAARALTHLPGVRDTELGEAAEQFTEGAMTRQVARHVPLVGNVTGPMVGAMLLTDRDPEHAEVDDQGRVLSRPMLVPAVGEMLESWTVPKGAEPQGQGRPDGEWEWFEDENGEMVSTFSPLQPPRMGMFTPVAAAEPSSNADETTSEIRRDKEHSEYAADMNEEELEQHMAEQMQSNRSSAGSETGEMSRLGQIAAALEKSAEALQQAAQMQLMLGQLQVSGGGNVAGVLGDTIRVTQNERAQNGEPLIGGMDNIALADRMARVMGITPTADGESPVKENLPRFGLFADQALRMGVSGDQAEQVVREVKGSPDGRLPDSTRSALIDQAQSHQGVSYDFAQGEVNRLEHSARMLPDEITAFGIMRVSPSPTIQPSVVVEPQIAVTVSVPQTNQPTAYDDASRDQAALDGSGSVIEG